MVAGKSCPRITLSGGLGQAASANRADGSRASSGGRPRRLGVELESQPAGCGRTWDSGSLAASTGST